MPSSLRLYNTLSGRKERFVSTRPGEVNMFVCGPTVQSLIHIGQGRTYIFYDVLARYLRHLGYRVNYLMNVTDLDERISQAAARSNEDPFAVARRFTEAFRADMLSLKCTSVSRFEPVSAHVETMIRQVASLVRSGLAYVAGGWVYFDTSNSKSFGRLSHQSKEDLSIRPLDLSAHKRHLTDFALWRPDVLVKGKCKAPWGTGSPSWHIQDTAVTLSLLGIQYDIHGGAQELVYPHHDAQMAQGEALTGVRPLAKYWIHTHHVNFRGRKMSQSLGNVITVKRALRKLSASELRLFLLGTHYRRDMAAAGMEAASKRLRRLRRLVETILNDRVGTRAGVGGGLLPAFEVAMNDDLNIPRAISIVERALEKAASGQDLRTRMTTLAKAVSSMEILGVELLGSP